jgi:GT2 family glycosyltransferase
MKPTASVIIPVHNAEEVLAEQLSALADQSDAPPFEVLVVLNRCADRSGAVAIRYQSALELTVLEANEKQSASYARNLGAARAAGPYLLFCDADDRVGDRWVVEMVNALAGTDADFVGGHPIVDRRNLPRWIYDDFYRETDSDGLNRHFPGLLYPITASFGISRAAFDAVGGFDDSFPATGHEDIDLTARLGRAGFRIGVAPKADVLYRPRTAFRALVRQRRGYADGGAHSLFKDGTPIVPQSLLDELRTIARLVGRLVVRDKQWRPTALTANALDEWFRYRRTQALPNERLRASTPADLVLDFTIDPATPVVGGLALLAPAWQGYRYATEGAGPAALALLSRLVEPGDIVVDAGADIGVATLCAALLLKGSGRVVSVDADVRDRDLISRNVQRHGVADLVSVAATLDADAIRHDEISVARIDLQRAPMANGLARFDEDRWSLWVVDEIHRTASRISASDPRGSSRVVLATPRSRDADVEAAIRNMGEHR